MSADAEVWLQTKERVNAARQSIQRMWAPCPQRACRLLGQTDESFYSAALSDPESVTSCQTRFYGQLVDSSAAINSPDPPSGLNSEVPGDCEGSRRTWAGGTSSPAWWTLKAAAGSSRRIIACELTSCNASIGKEAEWLGESPGRWWQTGSSAAGSGNTCLFWLSGP